MAGGVAANRAERITFPVAFVWAARAGTRAVTVSPARDRVVALQPQAGAGGELLWAGSVEVPAGVDVYFRVEVEEESSRRLRRFEVGPLKVYRAMRLRAAQLSSA